MVEQLAGWVAACRLCMQALPLPACLYSAEASTSLRRATPPSHRSEVERYRAETAAAANDDRTQQLRALSAELAAVEEQVPTEGAEGGPWVGTSAAAAAAAATAAAVAAGRRLLPAACIPGTAGTGTGPGSMQSYL